MRRERTVKFLLYSLGKYHGGQNYLLIRFAAAMISSVDDLYCTLLYSEYSWKYNVKHWEKKERNEPVDFFPHWHNSTLDIVCLHTYTGFCRPFLVIILDWRLLESRVFSDSLAFTSTVAVCETFILLRFHAEKRNPRSNGIIDFALEPSELEQPKLEL